MSAFDSYINKLAEDAVFSEQEMFDAISIIMAGDAPEPEMESFLVHLSKRPSTSAEIAGAARALRSVASTISAPPGTVDCCGTGGDGSCTFNISTAVALVSAACGVPVAKHGNRAASSKSGAADVLEALGINLALPKETLERALSDIGFCFLMAPNHHSATRHVVPVRRKLGTRTIFNLLGPLANPACARRQLLGVYDRAVLRPMADALLSLGTEKAWVVHGADGLDEISLSGETYVAIVDNGTVTERILTPADFGLSPIDPQDITGGDVQTNAAALRALLDGEKSSYRDIVLANTAAVLMIADKAGTLPEGVAFAAAAIDTGKASLILDRYKGYGV